jgi:ketosteroid isomerase-like protein
MNRSIILLATLGISALLSAATCSAAETAGNASPKTRKEVLAALDRLGALISKKDPQALSEFSPDDAILIGSEKGEVFDGRDQIGLHFKSFFNQPFTAHFEWKTVRISATGSVAWIFADGVAVVQAKDGDKRFPYRLAGVLENRNGRWLWRQFSGSEPQ